MTKTKTLDKAQTDALIRGVLLGQEYRKCHDLKLKYGHEPQAGPDTKMT
jgi:hypothetical protein